VVAMALLSRALSITILARRPPVHITPEG
jgi:hypothetical protein